MTISILRKKLSDEKLRITIANYTYLFAVVLLSICLLMLQTLKIDQLGLIHSFPFLYFIAIFCSLVSGFIIVTVKQKKLLLQLLNYLFLLAALWLIPIMLEGTPRFASAYKTIGFVEYIYREGGLNPTNWELFYHNWPGFSIFTAVLWMITGVHELYNFVLFYPVILHLLMVTVIYWLLKQPTIEADMVNGWYLGGAVYLIANFVNQDYFSPQSYGYYLLSIIIVLIINRKQWQCTCNRAIGLEIILMLIVTAIIISHILSSLVAIALIGVFFLSDRKNFANLLIFSLVVLISWTVYGAFIYFAAHASGIMNDMFELKRMLSANIENRVKGSPAHIFVSRARIIYAASFALCSFIGLLLFLKRVYRDIAGNSLPVFEEANVHDVECLPDEIKRHILYNKLRNLCKRAVSLFQDYYELFYIAMKNNKDLVNLIKVSFIGVCVAGAFIYGGESLMRAYLLMLLPMTFFCLGYINKQRWLTALVIFCTVAVPFHFIVHYGNEQIDYVAPAVIRGTDFLSEHSSGGYVVGHNQILGNTKDTEDFVSLSWEQYNEKSLEKNMDDKCCYLGIGPWERNYWSLFANDKTFTDNAISKLQVDKNCAKVYSNGQIDLYYLNTRK